MPLDKHKGELIGYLGDDYVVVPLAQWGDTPLYRQAEDAAAAAFMASGAIVPFSFDDHDVVVQEYPRKHKLAFLFQKRIKGKEHFYPYVFDLPPQVVTELALVGRWGRKH